MAFAISDPSIVVNNQPVGIVPGSVMYTEGFGESSVRAQSSGNGQVDQIYSRNIETNFSMIKFSLYNDIDSINLARTWKTLLNANIITLNGVDPTTGNSITRTFSKASLISNYEVELGSESTFEVEFNSLPAV